MRKIPIYAVVIWSVALTSAGALAYTIQRPLMPQNTKAAVSAIRGAAAKAFADTSPAAVPTSLGDSIAGTFTVQPVRIVGRAHRALAPRPAARAREFNEMQCADWRLLMQGPEGNRVRACE